MARIGLSLDHLAALASAGGTPVRYAARVGGLNVLEGEVVALVGSGTDALLERLAAALAGCSWVDGKVAARAGSLRIHAQQAARVGVRALAVTGPFDVGLAAEARGLATADLASVGRLGLTTVVEVADVTLAALFAARVAVVVDGEPLVAYPVVASTPRSVDEVAPVAERVLRRLAASC